MKQIKDILVCPYCSERIRTTDDGKSLCCLGPKKHLWDIASSGYVNFSGSSGGDPKDAVRARTRFLSLGHYDPLAFAVTDILNEYNVGGTVIDAGCGEGYYDSEIVKHGYSVLGFDLSKTAVEAAAKRRLPGSFFAVAGINAMPVEANCADAVINIFAPCFENEFSRVLKPNGILIIAAAGKNHLLSLKEVLYDKAILNEERADLPCGDSFAKTDVRHITYDFSLNSNREIEDLFSMTPYCYRTSREAANRLSSLEKLTVEADFTLHIYRCKVG